MDLMNLLSNQLLNQDVLGKLGNSVNADPSQVQKLAQLGLPALMEALKRNASTEEGANALAGALEQHQDDNVDDVEDFLQKVDDNDGAKMLSHIFADKNDSVQNSLAKKTGLDVSQVTGLMTKFAPLLLGALGNQKKAQNLDASGIAGLTSQISQSLGQSGGGGLMNIAASLLDSDKDGDVMDNLGGLLGGLFKK